uniref:Uncharacterized protein n=1 Tax=viral metagenome TaxID=1070528 RepID=A0A6M3KX45_9ZZZZ
MSEPIKVKCACLCCGGDAVSLYADDTASIVWCAAGHVIIFDSLRDKGDQWKKVYDFAEHK